MPIDALSVLCVQLTRDLLAIAKFLLTVLCVSASAIVQLWYSLRSTASTQLVFPPVKLSTYGGRVLVCPDHAAVWNSIREILNTLETHQSFYLFRRYLKTYLFARY